MPEEEAMKRMQLLIVSRKRSPCWFVEVANDYQWAVGLKSTDDRH
jgi:hypothetical protein